MNDIEDHLLDEATSGSAWMFYNHYNPDLLAAMQKLLVGHRLENVVDGLVEGKTYAEKVTKAMERYYKKYPGKRPTKKDKVAS